MDYVVICLTSLLVAALTLFSGFGLGTILMPAFAFFFPLPAAVASTAVVHLANNLYKLVLVGKHASWPIVLRFGAPAVPASFLGATLLEYLSGLAPLGEYALAAHAHRVTWVGLIMGVLIAGFAILELTPVLERYRFEPKYLWAGGLLSGLFGGISGHQGAFRSAFLLRLGLSKEAFIATGVVCAVVVDLARLPVYGMTSLRHIGDSSQARIQGLIVAAILAAFIGSTTGAKLLPKVTMPILQRIVGISLLLIGGAIASGLV